MSKLCKTKYVDNDVMPAFWHRTRKCAVPLTPQEFALRIGSNRHGSLGGVLRELAENGLLRRKLSHDGVVFYEPTHAGARMAEALIAGSCDR